MRFTACSLVVSLTGSTVLSTWSDALTREFKAILTDGNQMSRDTNHVEEEIEQN